MFAGSPLLLLLLLLLVGSLVVCCGSSPELEVQTSAWLPTAGEVCVGWQPPPSDHAAQLFTPSCTIPRISATEWRHRLALGHLDSVVIEGAVDNSEFQAMTRRDELLRRYGSTSVILSSANTFSYAKREVRRRAASWPSSGHRNDDCSLLKFPLVPLILNSFFSPCNSNASQSTWNR